MLTPFPVSPQAPAPFHCFQEGAPPPTHWLPPPCPGISLHWGILTWNLHRTKGFSSHWCPRRPSFAMQLEPWVTPCVLFSWWFSPWELSGVWLVIIVLPMGLQTPSAPSVLYLISPSETLCSVQWLAASICLCICQALAEPLRRPLYQAPVSKHFLAFAIVSGFGDCIWDGSPGGAVSGWPFFQSLFHTKTRHKTPTLRWTGGCADETAILQWAGGGCSYEIMYLKLQPLFSHMHSEQKEPTCALPRMLCKASFSKLHFFLIMQERFSFLIHIFSQIHFLNKQCLLLLLCLIYLSNRDGSFF
jgi:hypothetical protein